MRRRTAGRLGAGGGPGGGSTFGGSTGVLRLLNDALGGQAGWLLGFALVAGVALFLYALRLLSPMPDDRAGFILLVALLAAGAMALADSVVGLVVAAIDKIQRRGIE